MKNPITDKLVLAWAKKKAKEQKPKDTAKYVLAEHLQAFAVSRLDGYDAGDLRELVVGLYWDGSKGYNAMSIDELLKAIQTDVVEPYLEDVDDEASCWEVDCPEERAPEKPQASFDHFIKWLESWA
jgi:hypothetical protein